ncbi:MAG: ABC transporter ATP-binding protein [Bacilli bacterium]|jgi:ABC-type lipoprotein export system ATPase subunit|nr:ABC transporter ATP-binding protein [Bacilli bacterium]MDY0064587.1 ABC transporter ATP-binding protein [Bacilli bacterium]
MIRLEQVDKIYGNGPTAVHALKKVNLEIEDGKFTAIVGRSGSGKSTLMNMIGGLDAPTNGKVYADQLVLNELNNDQLAEYRNQTTGFIFQSFYLEPTFTVLENVAMPLTIAGMDKKTREEKAVDVLKKLGLEDKINKKANELSGGQKQRVSIARAIVHNPKIVLADEPTGNLDSQSGAEVMKLLKEICAMGKSVVLVTHNLEDAANADRIIVIKDGITYTDEETVKQYQPLMKKRGSYEVS